jgi:multiple antibiotic resistance protein
VSDAPDLLRTTASLVAVVNPLGAVPAFLAISRAMPGPARRRAARTAAATVALALLAAGGAGGALLATLGIGIPAFRAAGGILLLTIAVSMLQPRPPGSSPRAPGGDPPEPADRAAAVTPIGIPLLAGPGAISATIVHAQSVEDAGGAVALGTAALAAGAAAWAALRLAEPVARLVGPTGLAVASRLMGLVLAATAVEFLAKGLAGLFPSLAR